MTAFSQIPLIADFILPFAFVMLLFDLSELPKEMLIKQANLVAMVSLLQLVIGILV